MHTRARAILAVTVVVAVTAMIGLVVTSEQPAHAKGVVKSSSGGSSNSDSSSASSSSSDRDDSGSSSRSSSSSSPSRSSSSSSSRSSIDSRSEIRRYEAPSSSTTNRLDQDFYLRSAGSQLDAKRPTPTYRKDYAEIGEIWKGRQEKRDDSSRSLSSHSRTDSRRDGWYYNRDDAWRWSMHDHASPFRYRHYCYDYRPTYCYPSVYCYYYDYYPPYIAYDRVVIITRLPNARFCAEIPIFIYKRSGDYYLSNSTERSLWAALRDVQRAWERSDPELVMDHVERRSVVDIYLSGEYSYSVEEMDYYDMTRDAMSVIQTRSFDFDKVSRLDDNRYVAHGMHIYTDRYSLQKTVFVTYTFQRYRDEWYITAVGSSTHPI